MKKMIFGMVALMSFSATQAIASVKFEATNNDFVTSVCYQAATQGLDAAKELVTDRGFSFRNIQKSVTCNGKSLDDFAAQYAKRQIASDKKQTVQLVAENNNLESKVCIDALTNGIDKAVSKYKINPEYIRCNRVPLPRFVAKNKHKNMVVAIN
uniref:hypothetical protein n=1 Tax=Ningiella ruwaisensis TaxID=2364274 RepID=UPI0010A073FD|nr:hypothetical protein [Ningiella ruwaisensis]